MYKFLSLFLVLAVVIVSAGCDEDSTAQDMEMATVKVQNLTVGQPFSATLVIVHNGDYSLFENGDPASEELERLAEDGDAMPLMEVLANNDNVFGTFIGDASVMPLQSQEVEIEFTQGFNRVTVAQMLVNTNDAFYAARNITIPASGSIGPVRAPAYDAGTEADDENCDNIPGPACMGDSNLSPETDGVVYISNGVHGTVLGSATDLDPSVHDWRNPVADITVSRPADDDNGS